jgi:hypothetical protein
MIQGLGFNAKVSGLRFEIFGFCVYNLECVVKGPEHWVQKQGYYV